MTSFIDNFVERYILDKQVITDFYHTLITHYHCIDDFKLNTNYSILVFKELLFKIEVPLKCFAIQISNSINLCLLIICVWLICNHKL